MATKWTVGNCKNQEERARLERIAELSEGIRKHDKEVKLDFSKPEHRELFLLEFGGEEYFKREFPKFYARFQKTMSEAHEHPTAAVSEESEFHDAAQIVYLYLTWDETAVLRAETALKDTSEEILAEFNFYNQATGALIWSDRFADHNTNCLKYNRRIQNTVKRELGGPIMCDYLSTWVDAATGHVMTSMYSYTLDLSLKSAVQKVEVTNPAHKKTAADSAIVVCYNRKSSSGENVDYDDYQEAFDPVTGKQKLYLDVSGRAVLLEEHRPYQWIDPTDFVLKLYCDSGFAEYNLDDRQQELMKSFVRTDDGFSFALDKDWQGSVPAARLPIVEDVNFLLRFSVMTARSKTSVLISSELDVSEVTTDRVRISKLHLLWGCVEEHTYVTMADGSLRHIKDVRPHEQVMINNGIGTVKDIMCGEEARLLRLETEDGKSLVCTREHPVLTTAGMKPAHMLRGDDTLIAQGGQATKLTALYETAGGRVCSLWLEANGEEEQAVVTNGLYAGDFTAQNAVMRRVKALQKEASGKKPDEETLKLLQYFKGRDQ